MGFRFRKSIKLGGGFRINISKSGIGYSWGCKGYRITKTARGTIRQTVSIPGTGISFVDESGKIKRDNTPHLKYTDSNYFDTQEIQNSVATDIVSDGLESILESARRTMQINDISTFGIIIPILLSFKNEILILLWIVSIILKIYAKTIG